MADVLGGHVAHRFGLPSVTGYLLIGIIIGPSVTGLIRKADLTALQPVNDFALGLIGLSIGGDGSARCRHCIHGAIRQG